MTYYKKKIWIDMDNSPHVPFFKPIIAEINKLGIQTTITARDCFQVCDLADLHEIKYKKVGRHYGKNKIMKVYGTIFRAVQLLKHYHRERPIIALSHGSRSQLLTSKIVGIESVVIDDYEHAAGLGAITPNWMIMPEVILKANNNLNKKNIYSYPGIKEDVYINQFYPDPTIRTKLGINSSDIMVTIRPPATEAHYRRSESDFLFNETVNFLGKKKGLSMVILPRNEVREKRIILEQWPDWFKNQKILIPDKVLNGLDLIWYSDFVISGGGTMNREAAALGVPVYSIFRGKIGAVDKYLSSKGRLTLIENNMDISDKLQVKRRNVPEKYQPGNTEALDKIVKYVASILSSNIN